MKLPAPTIQAISDREWRFEFDYCLQYGAWRVSILAGFVSDLLSIPRVAWRLVGHPAQGLAQPAGVVHDALYCTQLLPRAVADAYFYRLLLANGVSRCRAWVMFRAVRAFGGAVWRSKTAAQIAEARRYVSVISTRRVQFEQPPSDLPMFPPLRVS